MTIEITENKLIEAEQTGVPITSLEETIQRNGYGEGRLFFSTNRATYTLIHHNEVVSIHFDLNKQNLYWQGHKVSHLDEQDCLEELLSLFKRELVIRHAQRELVQAFDATVSKLSQNQ